LLSRPNVSNEVDNLTSSTTTFITHSPIPLRKSHIVNKMLLLRIALPVFLAYLFTALSLGMFIIFLATEYDNTKLLELLLFSCMGLLDILGLIYLFVMRKRILGVYRISDDGLSFDMEKGEKQRLISVGREKSDRVMDLY